MRSLILVIVAALLVGCAAGQRLEQDGPLAWSWGEASIRFMRQTPNFPPRPCPIKQVVELPYLETQEWPWYRADKWFSDEKPPQTFKSCPLTDYEINLDKWTPVQLTMAPSPFSVVVPEVVRGAMFIGGMATLGALMPGTEVTNNNVSTGSTLFGSTIQGQPIQGLKFGGPLPK